MADKTEEPPSPRALSSPGFKIQPSAKAPAAREIQAAVARKGFVI
jgi:hypothetical protein